MPTIDELDQLNPDFNLPYHAGLWGLYRGSEVWHGQATRWLPKRFAETQKDYAERLSTAVYDNKSAPVVDTFAQWLFEQPPELPEATTKAVSPAVGAPGLVSVLSLAFTHALIHRRGWVFVDMPTTEATNLAEQEARGEAQPQYLVIDPLNVVDWALDRRGRVEWAIIREVVHERAGLGPRAWWVQWTYVDATQVTKYRRRLAPEELAEAGRPGSLKGGAVERHATSTPPGGVCPLVCLELPEGLWAMDRLHDPAVGHLRANHALDWALDRSAFALLGIFTADDGSGNTAAVGPGYAIQLAPDDRLEYVESSGAAFSALRTQKQDYEQAVYRAMRQMALATNTNATGTASGAAKARDMDPMRTVLKAYRDAAEAWVHRVVDTAVAVSGAPKPPAGWTVAGMDAWRDRTLGEFFEAVVLATGAMTMSPTMAREVAKTQARMLLEGTSGETHLEAIYKEIEEADPAMGLAFAGKQMGDDVAAALAGGGGEDAPDEDMADDKREAQAKSGQGRLGAAGA